MKAYQSLNEGFKDMKQIHERVKTESNVSYFILTEEGSYVVYPIPKMRPEYLPMNIK